MSAKLVARALQLMFDYGSIDGAHHKQWIIDQLFREIFGDNYEGVIEDYEEEFEEWDTGIAP